MTALQEHIDEEESKKQQLSASLEDSALSDEQTAKITQEMAQIEDLILRSLSQLPQEGDPESAVV